MPGPGGPHGGRGGGPGGPHGGPHGGPGGPRGGYGHHGGGHMPPPPPPRGHYGRYHRPYHGGCLGCLMTMFGGVTMIIAGIMYLF